MVDENNTTKLASLWETKINGSEEKGVRKSQKVDIPDEQAVVKTYSKNALSSTDSSPTTVLKSKSKSTNGSNPNKEAAIDNRSDAGTRGIVESKFFFFVFQIFFFCSFSRSLKNGWICCATP